LRSGEIFNINIASSSLQQVEIASVQTGSGNDTINVSSVTNYAVINSGAGNDSITGTVGGDLINGEAGDDTINAGGGNDTINTGTGNDTVNGGAGYDSVFMNRSGETADTNIPSSSLQQVEFVSLSSGSGNDTIDLSSVTNYVSASGGAGNDTITGTVGGDTLYGDAGDDNISAGDSNDIILTGTGNDTVNGGAGSDTVYIERSAVTTDIIILSSSFQQVEFVSVKTGSGNDSIDISSVSGIGTSPLGFSTISAGAGNDVLKGGTAGERFFGEAGNDSIDGGSGDDVLNGGDGNDILNPSLGDNDVFGEAGTDTLKLDYSSVSTAITSDIPTNGEGIISAGVNFIVYEGIEKFNITGTALADNLIGGGGADIFRGGGGNDTIVGGGGNDILNGGSGSDSLTGGGGNDTYIIDAADTITENAGQGTDTIQAGFTISLANFPNIENLILTGTANLNGTGTAGNNSLTGNGGNNTLTGGAGNDILNGGAGIDTLIGGLDSDTYIVDTTTDTITENAGEGTDAIQSSVTFTLASLTNIENLTLTGTSNINGTGNASNNNLAGNAGNNSLNGSGGGDILNGGAGKDILTGGAAGDTLVFQFGQSTAANFDSISDFAIGTDKIDLLTQGGAVTGAPTAFSRASNSTAATLTNAVNGVFIDANGATIGDQALGVNSAALVVVTAAGIAGTYLVINDSVAGFQDTVDTVVNITGYSGTLPNLGAIPVNNFFV
jgi:Ca2+-binding RTX toxin-like protein